MSNKIVLIKDSAVIEGEFEEVILSWKGKPHANIYVEIKNGSWSEKKPYPFKGEDQILSRGSAIRLHVDGEYFVFPAFITRTPLTPFLGKENRKLSSFPYLSQLTLDHPDHMSMCMATSLAAATSFITKKTIDPILLAKKAFDHAGNIYGNWAFGAAAANAYLDTKMWCVTKLSGFGEIYDELAHGNPVIVSVRGGPLPYKEGHLMVVIGWENENVVCMDPASEKKSYPYDHFIKAWENRGRYAFVLKETPKDR